MKFTRQQTKAIKAMLKHEYDKGMTWGIIVSIATLAVLSLGYIFFINQFPNLI